MADAFDNQIIYFNRGQLKALMEAYESNAIDLNDIPSDDTCEANAATNWNQPSERCPEKWIDIKDGGEFLCKIHSKEWDKEYGDD